MMRFSYALATALCLIAAPAFGQDAGPDGGDDASLSEDAAQDDAAPAEDDAALAGDAAPAEDDAAPAEDDADTEAGEEDAGPDESCYSPTQNLDIAYDEEAIGCPCEVDVDEDACIDGVALTCDEGSWLAVEDLSCGAAPADPDPIPLCSATAAGRSCGTGRSAMVLLGIAGALMRRRGRQRRVAG